MSHAPSTSKTARAHAPAGIVGAHVRVHPGKRMARVSPAGLVQAIEAGLPIEELDALQAGLDLPMEKLAPILGMSRATLHRRRIQGRLDRHESDRVVRYARLFGRALDLFEREEDARRWLASPQVGLGGAIPLEFAMTEVGAREVEDLLGRIDYGVYT